MENKSHILIVDDDIRIVKLLKKFLHQNNFMVSTSTSVYEASEMIKNFTFDLIILDVMLPGITGVKFAKMLRNDNNDMPIVMLTALSEAEDRIAGLEAGASDYVTKPFEPKELLLRINNLINTNKKFRNDNIIIKIGNYNYNINTHCLYNQDEVIKLSSAEINLLEFFISNKSKNVSREDIAQAVGRVNDRSVDVQIARIRNKIEIDPKNPQILKTIRNIGYVLYI